ncbi:ATP-binding protein [Streptomyces acidicola]|uniref:ATP-binding protein n=1 Tax=Streptomyces acidicola TaxID=2596892 RepID=UPI0037F652EC
MPASLPVPRPKSAGSHHGSEGCPLRQGHTIHRDREAVGRIRRFAHHTLRSWGVGEVLDAALLVVSELVTNVIEHTDGPGWFELILTSGRLRIEVTDFSHCPPVVVVPGSVGEEAVHGRGMTLVDALSAAWGVTALGRGKRVWSDLLLEAEI